MVGRKRKTGVFDIINDTILIMIGLTMLYPFIYLLLVSISPIETVMKGGFLVIPTRLSFTAYKYVFQTGIDKAYTVTLISTIGGIILSLTLTSLGAYVLSNKNIVGWKFLTTLLIITMIFSGGLIPTYLVVKNIGLIDKIAVLFIPNAINTFWLFIMRNFFQSIPGSLAESARIDGCSEYKILIKLILPLSLPIVATLALFYGVGFWNQYFNAIIYINSSEKYPLQVIIRMMYQSALSVTLTPSDMLPPPVQTIRAATIMIATLPILCVYPFLQKYFAKGIMVGAIKG